MTCRGVKRLAGCASAVALAVSSFAATPAHALVITATFQSAITSSPNAAAIENSINTAVNAIAGLYSDPGTVNILFTMAPGSFLGQSTNVLYTSTYAGYVSLLAADAAAHPSNTVLATAVANLSHGNDANGARNIAGTSALFRVGLGAAGVTPCFNSSGTFVSTCGQLYDGIVTLSSTQSISYTRPLIPGFYDAVRIVEHEVDEILGGGGGGSTLNQVASFGLNNPAHPLTFDYGAFDLYRYSAPNTPSFTTLSSATAYFSVDGGATSIAGLNQSSTGDFGDYLSPGCVAQVQVAFTCNNQIANFSKLSPEFKMLEALGYDPVPEPASIALLGMAAGGLGLLRKRRSQAASPQTT